MPAFDAVLEFLAPLSCAVVATILLAHGCRFAYKEGLFNPQPWLFAGVALILFAAARAW
jgi:hypothetical protein